MLDGSWLPLGRRGERRAARYLRSKGMRILAHSFRSNLGEIDLVALDGATIVFVEVKTRAGDQFGDPVDAVDREKRRRIVRASAAFLKAHQLSDHAVRFDVVSIVWPSRKWFSKPVIEHFEAAFDATPGAR